MTADHSTGPAHPNRRHRIRIYELAQRLGIPPRDVIRQARAVEIEVRSVLQSLDQAGVRRMLEDYQHPATYVNGASPDPGVVHQLLSDLAAGQEIGPENGSEPADELVPDGWEMVRPDDPKPGLVEDLTAQSLESPPPAEMSTEPVEAEPEPIVHTGYARAFKLATDKSRGWYENLASRAGLSDRGRRMARVAVAIVAGTALLAATLAALRPLHAAESEVVVTIAGLGSGEVERELQNFNVVASSQTVLGPVAEELGISLRELRDSLSSEIVGDSTVLRFVVSDRDPERAREINEAIVASYLSIANQPIDQAQVSFLDSQISEVGQRLNDTADRLETLDIAEAANEATRLRIETDQAIAQSRFANLESRLVDLRSGGEAPSGAVSFVEGQIIETRAVLDALIAELQALESADSVAARAEAERLRDERDSLREELVQLGARRVDLELDQIGGPRARVLTPAHILEERVGVSPIRALALGILVGGVMAFAWIVGATQLRRGR